MPAADPNMDFESFEGRVGYNLRRLRTQQGLTPQECADAIGVSVPSWYRMESGWFPQMLGRHMRALASLFGVEMRELVKKPRSRPRKKPEPDRRREATA